MLLLNWNLRDIIYAGRIYARYNSDIETCRKLMRNVKHVRGIGWHLPARRYIADGVFNAVGSVQRPKAAT